VGYGGYYRISVRVEYMAHCSLERSTCNPQFVVDGIILEPRESAAHAAWRVGGKQHCMGSFGCRLHVNTA